jgi:hypothetical protein
VSQRWVVQVRRIRARTVMIASARSKNASTTTWRGYRPGRSTIRPTHSAVTRGLRRVPTRRGDVRRPLTLTTFTLPVAR